MSTASLGELITLYRRFLLRYDLTTSLPSASAGLEFIKAWEAGNFSLLEFAPA